MRYLQAFPLGHFIVRIMTAPLHYNLQHSSNRFFGSGAIPQSVACGIEQGMQRPLPPIHLNTLSGYRCGVGRTAKQSQIVPAYFWLVTIITLYIQKQNIKFVKIFRSFCRDNRTPRGSVDCRQKLIKVYNPFATYLCTILYKPLLLLHNQLIIFGWCPVFVRHTAFRDCSSNTYT